MSLTTHLVIQKEVKLYHQGELLHCKWNAQSEAWDVGNVSWQGGLTMRPLGSDWMCSRNSIYWEADLGPDTSLPCIESMQVSKTAQRCVCVCVCVCVWGSGRQIWGMRKSFSHPSIPCPHHIPSPPTFSLQRMTVWLCRVKNNLNCKVPWICREVRGRACRNGAGKGAGLIHTCPLPLCQTLSILQLLPAAQGFCFSHQPSLHPHDRNNKLTVSSSLDGEGPFYIYRRWVSHGEV